MSALEHAVSERFFNDPAQCNLVGEEKPVAVLPNCPQGISAVKALGLAAAQGQRIYTITPEVYAANPNIVNTALSAHSVDTKGRVQRALDSGMEVTIHQAPIVESGWKGAGFNSIEPTTGAGGYSIEGGSNGSILLIIGAIIFIIGIFGVAKVLIPAFIMMLAGGFYMFAALTMFEEITPTPEEESCNFLITGGAGLLALALGYLMTGFTIIMLVVGISTTLLMALQSTAKGITDICKRK
jgi:hypothetical protein